MRHRRLTCAARKERNLRLTSVLFTKSARYRVSFYRPEIDFILPLCSSVCFTCSQHMVQKCYKCAVVSKGDCFAHSSSRESKEAVTDRKQLFIQTDSLKVAAAVGGMSRTTGPIRICLFHTRYEKHPRFQHRQGGITAFPYVVPCRHGCINLSPVARPFI